MISKCFEIVSLMLLVSISSAQSDTTKSPPQCPKIKPMTALGDFSSLLTSNYTLLALHATAQSLNYQGPCPKTSLLAVDNYTLDFSNLPPMDIRIERFHADGTETFTHIVVFTAVDNKLHIVYTCADVSSIIAIFQKPGATDATAQKGLEEIAKEGVEVANYFQVCGQ